MKDIDWLNNLKLRVSFGQSGNDNVGAYQTQGSISWRSVLFFWNE